MFARITHYSIKPEFNTEEVREELKRQLPVRLHDIPRLEHAYFMGERDDNACMIVALYDSEEAASDAQPKVQEIWRDYEHMVDGALETETYGVYLSTTGGPDAPGSAILAFLEDFKAGGWDPFGLEQRHKDIANAIKSGERGYAQGLIKKKRRIISLQRDGNNAYSLGTQYSLAKARATIMDGNFMDPGHFWLTPGYFSRYDYEERMSQVRHWQKPKSRYKNFQREVLLEKMQEFLDRGNI